MHATVSVNGRLGDAASSTISVFDHGFLYGEGVYETLRTYQGVPFLFDAHADRLRRSAARIALDVPVTNEALRDEVTRTIAAHGGAGEHYIRILLTRGVGELTYRPSACPTPTLVVIVKHFIPPPADTYDRGIRVALVDVRRNHRDTVDPHIKSNNLLNNALAMQQAYARGADEALMRNVEGHLVECAQSNVFLVRAGEVLTPALSDGLLPGITRAFVLDLARAEGIPARETTLTLDDLHAADEAFITGTTREVTPVIGIDDQPVRAGRPGPITLRLLDAFRRRTQA